jgi:hypothetical protein
VTIVAPNDCPRTNDSVILSEASRDHRDAQSKHPDAANRTGIVGTFLPTLLLALIFLTPHSAHAQGCAQCLDTTRSTPPAVQAAYRHAILLLIGAASTLFITGLILLRRNP